MAQDFFLIVEGVTVARTLNVLIYQISVLTVPNFKKKYDQTICSLRGDQAAFIPCRGRFILEKDTNVKKITCKHYGTHSCLLERKGRNKDAEDIARSFPWATRESFIRQKVQQELEENFFRDAVETAKSLTDKTFVDNVRRKEKSRRRRDDHCFEAIKLLQKTYEQEDRFLLYSCSKSAALPYVIKSSRLKLQLLQNLHMDGNHRLSKETVYLDVLHCRTGSLTYFEYKVLKQQ